MSPKGNGAQSTGSGAEQASTNGHVDPADLPDDVGRTANGPTALSGTLYAHLSGTDPDTPLNEALNGDALAAFNTHNSARRKMGLSPYSIDAPLCDIPALPIAVAHHAGLDPALEEITAWSAEAMEDDPHEVMAEFDATKVEFAAQHAAEHVAEGKAKHALRDVKVSPRTRFTLSTIEAIDGIGAEVAGQARAAVLQINRRAWSAIKPHNFAERNELISAVELHRLGVAAEVIAELAEQGCTATDDDEIEANERLARQRAHYTKYGTAEVIDVAGGMVSPEQMRDKEPPRRLLGHWLFRRQMSELIGEPGSGKTFVALGMGLSLATGTPRRTIGVAAPRRARVLYVAAEAHESVYLRVLGWCQQHHVHTADLTGWFAVYPGAVQLSDPEHMRQLRKYVRDNDVDLVILDTRHMVTMGLVENSSDEQGVAIRACKDMNHDGAATLVVHHTGKDGGVGGGGRGSGAWFAAAYTSMYLKRDDRLGPLLVCDKLKDGKAKDKHVLHYAPVTVAAELMPNAREDERGTQALTTIDPMADAGEVHELTPKEVTLLLLLAHHGGFKGMTVTEIVRHARTKDDPDTGYDVGSKQTIYDSLNVLRDIDGKGTGTQYLRVLKDKPMSCRVTEEGWDLLVERGTVSAAYAEAHRFTAEDVGSEQFVAACENIAAAMTELIAAGEVIASNNQTEAAARKLVESEFQRKEQEFSATAWASVFSRWKEDGRPAKVETAAQAQSKNLP